MSRIVGARSPDGLLRELGQSILLLALTGGSVGAVLSMIAIAARVVGRG